MREKRGENTTIQQAGNNYEDIVCTSASHETRWDGNEWQEEQRLITLRPTHSATGQYEPEMHCA